MVARSFSPCNRRKVGAVITVNGLFVTSKTFNHVEGKRYEACECNGKSKPNVAHAEALACKELKEKHGYNTTTLKYSLYVTMLPCQQCAEKIVDAGIKEVFWWQQHGRKGVVEYLLSKGIYVERIEIPYLEPNDVKADENLWKFLLGKFGNLVYICRGLFVS